MNENDSLTASFFRRDLSPIPLQDDAKCPHFAMIHLTEPTTHVCVDCLKSGDEWLHLRMCLTCGYVGCGDDSKNKHATQHFYATEHPMIRSLEPGDHWGWCYVDLILFEMQEVASRKNPRTFQSQRLAAP